MKGPKRELRAHIKELLKKISDEEKNQRELSLGTFLVDLLSSNHVSIPQHFLIGGFAPLGDEVDWMKGCSRFNQSFCFPGMKDDKMVFFHCDFESLIATQDFGVTVQTPPSDAPVVTPHVLIIPGLGFTTDGHRLGRGKGFYDRYLEKYTGIKIGIGLSEQIIEDLPTEEHDIEMNFVVSDLGVFEKGKKIFGS